MTDRVRDVLSFFQRGIFVLFVLAIVVTYGWVCYVGLFDYEDTPIHPERFNQIWTSVSALVGAIVGWLIRELTHGNNEDVNIQREKDKAMRAQVEANNEIQILNSNLQSKHKENYELSKEILNSKEEIQKVKDEIKILGALKSDLPEEC